MNPGIYPITSAIISQERRLEVLTNNLANINTVGFKGDYSSFDSFVFRFSSNNRPAVSGKNFAVPGENKNYSIPHADYYPFFQGTNTDFSSGSFKETGNSLDLALSGNGFFAVKTPDGVRYTRAGNFRVNSEKILVNQDGFPVLGEGGEITIDDQDLVIGRKGKIFVDGEEGGQLKVVDFPQPYRLKKVGNNLFASPESVKAEKKPEDFQIHQGTLETSNVDPVKIMISMVELLRIYESCQKTIQAVSGATSKLIDKVGGRV